MRSILLAATLLPLSVNTEAQQRDTTRAPYPEERHGLAREVANEVVALYNAPGTMRAMGSLEIAAGREIEGDVAVLDGPLTIAGRIAGDVAVINGDLYLRPLARIEGNVIVVGGVVDGASEAYIGGDVRVYREVLHFHVDGERIVADRSAGDDRRWWARRRSRSRSRIHLFSASTYNRVEGLPVFIGPRIRHDTPWGAAKLEVFGIIRSAEQFEWDSENLGHRVNAEVQVGQGRSKVAVGGLLFDVVEGVEQWHLTDAEVGLASFFLHRDYRDYFNRHGATAYLSMMPGRDVDLRLSYSDERWASRRQRDPFTVFRNSQAWRPNPQMDDGKFHLANTTLRIDTRNDEENPWSGWYITADYEYGTGRMMAFGPTSPLVRDATAPGTLRYHRGFLDFRRYNRVSPDGQLNLRFVLGGWLGGDELPLQRRFSVGGPGTLPGFDFREPHGDTDTGFCGAATVAVPGHPAQCERVALAQAEYRGELELDLFSGGDARDRRSRRRWFDRDIGFDADWIVFLDAGRGWLVGPRSAEIRYPSNVIPPLGTFRTDVGVGLDVGIVGLYVAKALSHSSEPANFFVRVRHRF